MNKDELIAEKMKILRQFRSLRGDKNIVNGALIVKNASKSLKLRNKLARINKELKNG